MSFMIFIFEFLCPFFFLNLQDWDSQDGSQIATELCGFVTILSGTFLLHKTQDMGNSTSTTDPPQAIHQSPNQINGPSNP